ncbi:MAG: hypothetical protein JNJ88_15210 [Planctomycetes bacterium]|nr:hypothetical protein [Planctomycetota bacterium]
MRTPEIPGELPTPNMLRAAALLALLAGALLVAAAQAGPDYERYLDWARVALSGDLFEIRSDVRSPMGVPFHQWSHGPGFFLAIPSAATGGLLPVPWGARLAGAVAALALFLAWARALMLAARGSRALVVLGLGLAFLATHAGFYATAYGTATLSLAAGAIVAARLLDPRPWTAAASLTVGVGCAVALLARVPLGALVVTAVLWALVRAWRDRPRTFWIGSLWLDAVALGAPLVAALVQIGFVYRWMTGSPLRSPYNFGDGQFASVDLARAEFGTVLWHSYHGLLAYHPLYALGAAAMVAALVRRLRERRWLGAAAVMGLAAGLAAQLVIVASWYCWWMGEGSFGQRGLAAGTLVLLPLLLEEIELSKGRRRTAWLAAASLCGLWSAALLWRGESAFPNWADLADAQLAMATHAAFLVAIVASAAVGAATHARLRCGTPAALGIAAAGLSIATLLRRALLAAGAVERGSGLLILGTVLGAVGGAWLAARALDPTRWETPARAPSRWDRRPWWGRIGVALLTVAFLAECGLFLRIAVRTENALSARDTSSRPLKLEERMQGPVPLSSVEDAIRELERLPEFRDQREELLQFHERVLPAR